MSKVQILEAPSVLVLDGMEASINVGKEIPIATSTFNNPYVQQGGSTTTDQYNITNTQIQYRATGVNLSVAPRISATGIVTLEIAAEVSSPGNKDEGLGGSPPINRAVINTTMVVKDGSSIVLAGLISEQNEDTHSTVPFIGRVPLLGWLFSATSFAKNRSELLVILTPHVVHTTENAVLTSDAVISSLKSINKYISAKQRQGEFGIFPADQAKPKSANPAEAVQPPETAPEQAKPEEPPAGENTPPTATEQVQPAAPNDDESVQPPPAKETVPPPPKKAEALPDKQQESK
jgi:type II secretory pathway component GspD/PulD (secretin)